MITLVCKRCDNELSDDSAANALIKIANHLATRHNASDKF